MCESGAKEKMTELPDSQKSSKPPRSVFSQSSLSAGEVAGREVRQSRKRNKAIRVGRLVFVAFLGVVAAVLGYLAYFILTSAEENLAESQFESIAERALIAAQQILERKEFGAKSMASIAGNTFPDTQQWPNVAIPGFEDISKNILLTAKAREMAFAPMIKPEQLESFEQFAFGYFEQRFHQGIGDDEWLGVWGVNQSLNRYHVTNATTGTDYASDHEVFTPIIQTDSGAHPSLMLNIHFEEVRGKAMDRIIDCAMERQEIGGTIDCGAISDYITLTNQEDEPNPGAKLFQPIYPANDPFEVSAIELHNVANQCCFSRCSTARRIRCYFARMG